MSRDIYHEAELILGEFSDFWAVNEDINHLYGIVQKTGVKEYYVEVFFNVDFPRSPPQLKISKNIVDLLGNDISLKTLERWNENSHVVDVLRELKLKIEKRLEDDYLDLKVAPKQDDQKIYSEFSTPEPFIFHGDGKQDLQVKPATRPPEEFKSSVESAPESDDETSQEEEVNVPEHKVWSETDLLQGGSTGTGTQIIDESAWAGDEKESIENKVLTGDPMRDARLKEEHDKIMMEYSFDYNSNIADINIYLTISIESTFIIKINYFNYPERPIIEFPPTLSSLIKDPLNELNSLRNWNPSNPPHVIDIIHELESRLWRLNDIEMKIKKIFGEFDASYLPDSKTAISVTLLTYGFQEYRLTIDLKDYPSKPIIKYGPNLAALIKTPPDRLKVMQNWDTNEDKEAVAILREINWLVDKESRMAFEITLLQNSLKEVKYDSLTKTILVKMKGTMKTEEKLFEFKATLPENYPLGPPTIELLSELDDESMEKKMNASLKTLFSKWVPSSSYLIDAFNVVSKAIFEVSVITCIICHKFECPTCGLPMDSADLSQETCKVVCPYCERSYHKHCWDQTIATFGKCGFCLRPPPPNMMP
ncbi:MAG: hypothetical protein ACTSVI_05860 [Promethearchaeota archaeon]